MFQGLKDWWSGSRSTRGEDSPKAWYELHLKADVAGHKKHKDALSEKSVVKAFAKHGVTLEPLHLPQSECPVLTINEAYDHDEFDVLIGKSNVQSLNKLMVIITSVPVLENTDRLVQVKWDKSKHHILDYRDSIAQIRNFVRVGWKRQPIQTSKPTQDDRFSGHGASSAPQQQPPTPFTNPLQLPERRQGGYSADVSLRDRTWSDEAREDTSEAGQGTTERGTVHYALDREVADELLEKAVAFVGEVGNLRMVRVREDFGRFTPLFVICKNDTQLQEDIDHAMRNTREGDDVMLIVITDRKNQVLADTEATKAFGQKVCLFWSHEKKKFRKSEHTETMVWIRDFLQPYDIKPSLRRTNSLNRSIRKRIHGVAKGFYQVPLADTIPEEWMKKIVSFFHDQLVELEKSITRPLVLLMVDKDDMEKNVLKFLRHHRLVNRDVHVVVIHRGDNLRQLINVAGLTFLGLRMHDVNPEVLPSPQNRRTAEMLKTFLTNFKPPEENSDEQGTSPPQEDRGVAGSDVQQHYADLPPSHGKEMDGGDGTGDSNRTAESMDGLEHGEANYSTRARIQAPMETCIDNPETNAQRQKSQPGNRLVRTGEEGAEFRYGDGGSAYARVQEQRTGHENPPLQYHHPNQEERTRREHPSPQDRRTKHENPPHQHHNPQYHSNQDQRTQPENPPHLHHPSHHHPNQEWRTDHDNHQQNRHHDNRRREEWQETSMDFEDSESGRGSNFSKQSDSRRHDRKRNTCPRNLDYRSENYEKNPNQPQSQRKRDRRQRPTILQGGQYAQDGATLPTRAAAKRGADETLDEVISAMGAVSISGKEKKQDSSSMSNFFGAPTEETLRPKSRARRRTRNR